MESNINNFLASLEEGTTGLLSIKRCKDFTDKSGNNHKQYQAELAQVINANNNANGNMNALSILNKGDVRFTKGARRTYPLIRVEQAIQMAANGEVTITAEELEALQIKESLFVGVAEPHLVIGGNKVYFRVRVEETFEMDWYQEKDPENLCKRAGKTGPIIYGDNNGTRAMIFSNTHAVTATKDEYNKYVESYKHTWISEFVEQDVYKPISPTETVNTATGELITDLRL
tara:strand:- start:3862 stop:4551 length:690 start_codon:yes stop_codon:yes gene_type:complete